jgi:hypothetical protein
MRTFLRAALLLSLLWVLGCPAGNPIDHPMGTSSSSGGGGGGAPGHDGGPCALDCTKLDTGNPCLISVCNTGQVLGPVGECVITDAPDGTTCDDGEYCTTGDVCTMGKCHGPLQQTCGMAPNPCVSVLCYESTHTCSTTPVNDGIACTPTDVCEVNGHCVLGSCAGAPKDCSFSPQSECNLMVCDPNTGMCTGKPDGSKDGKPCVFTGDLCSVDKACLAGACLGGKPKDCSALTTVDCQVGSCDSTNGNCVAGNAPMGTSCTQGIQDCQVGTCDAKGNCNTSNAADGTLCNDHQSCTQADTCTGGVCAGMPVAGCSVYFYTGFEPCTGGFTLNPAGDWQCGKPMNPMGPATSHSGMDCIATQIANNYHNNDDYSTSTADSPTIDLTKAVSPLLSYWVWMNTELNYDGWNIKVSTDNGQSFTEIEAPPFDGGTGDGGTDGGDAGPPPPPAPEQPPYNGVVNQQQAYSGDLSNQGWANFTADLTPFAGQKIILRYAFHSDSAHVAPGVYIDDLTVAEPPEIPLYITTLPPLKDVYADQKYAVQINAVGGSNLLWSLVSPSQNALWLTIDPATGLLKGKPTPADVGQVTVTVKVEEMGVPTNFAEQTYVFNVLPNIYYESWESGCPDGWTLAGDWSCGVPTIPAIDGGPGSAYDGMNCISTGLTGNYSPFDTYAAVTATSPTIDLTSAMNATLSFRLWNYTEGGYDGVNLQVSTNGGTTYNLLTTVMPDYNYNTPTMSVANEFAWSGNFKAYGWRLITADLTPFIGQKINLQFAFTSDGANEYPGVYVDDFLVK